MTVYLDTNIVIYAVEKNPIFGPRASSRLAGIQTAGNTLMVSELTRMECLVMPFRLASPTLLANYDTFFAMGGLRMVDITRAVCEEAARIRAHFSFKPMDSLQLAAAVVHGATTFLTNDTRLSAFSGLTVEVL